MALKCINKISPNSKWFNRGDPRNSLQNYVLVVKHTVWLANTFNIDSNHSSGTTSFNKYCIGHLLIFSNVSVATTPARQSLKVHLKMKILSSFKHPHFITNQSFFLLWNTEEFILRTVCSFLDIQMEVNSNQNGLTQNSH